MNSKEMLEDQELLFDPKGLGTPPPYTEFATPSAPVAQTVPVAVPAPDPVIVQQPQVNAIPTSASIPDKIGPEAECMICKSCNKQIYTRVEYKPTTNTYLIAGICCLLLCWPCACYLYRSPLCRSIDHYCPNCDIYIGTCRLI
ncbi:lipopolysaccharide-induced tumor necrosis factor-alpha factor homolog [Spodoptera litura]|uniref:Lipopolysaccharide-induced tumor necrosis factor-alpha factor homolog n=1 Tax=Spodoptera litura TaxID=69820 RepID=A0A9J7EES7_SPOLT|nr:lipopolysaccharide-induced tumor necrosis factor-alpha factor homolog [Spodoptera litura]